MSIEMNKRLTVVTFLICLLMAASFTQVKAESSQAEHLYIAVIQSDSDKKYLKPVQRWFLKIYTEALKRMDIILEYRILPAKRASLYSDSGMLDGELSRVFNYNREHPNLIRVEEHHLLSVFSAFSADPSISVNGWHSLNGTQYNVEYRRGIKKCAENLPLHVLPENLSEISSIEDGVGKLLKGRSDIFIDSEDGIFDYLASEGFKNIVVGKNVGIYKVGVMEEVSSHFWLHKKHQNLVKPLSEILIKMKQEGLFELYHQQMGLSPTSLKW